jgi:hypothetical protein
MAGKPMTDDALLDILRKEEQTAQGFQDSILSKIREQALSYYDRQPYGDEQEGASSVVTSEFADVIESLMPGLMRVFTNADDLPKFAPMAPGQEQWAKEASEYVPHVLMRQNEGFRIISALLKDALMYRLSGTTVDLEPYEDKRTVPVEGISTGRHRPDRRLRPQQQGADLDHGAARGDLSARRLTNAQQASRRAEFVQPPETFSGTITIVHKRKRVVVDSIAPEDIRFSPTARTEDGASFLGFLKRTTASDLVKLGLSQDQIDDLSSERPVTVEDAQRNDNAIVGQEERDDTGDSERPLWLVVAYVRADVNGDGISELVRVVYAHAGGDTAGRIVEQVEWEGPASIALATPILMPHTITGRSLFDQTQDLQLIGSVLTRGLLDNLYIVNRPRPVISDQVNLDSLIDWVPGSPIRLKPGAKPGDNHVSWLSVPDVGSSVLRALEWQASVKENRTGVSRYNQGLDAESLNKTLGGLDRIMSASQERQDLIARTFAETSIKRLYRLVYRAIKRAASGPVDYWPGNSGTFAHCDPTKWPDEMDVTVDVVGIGNREQAMGHLGMVGALQEKLIVLQGGKADGPFVTAENVANGAQKLTETLGYKTPGLFFQPPDKVAATPPAQPQPDPTTQAAQAQIAILQQTAAAEIQIKRQKNEADIALEREKAAARLEIMRQEGELKLRLKREEGQINAMLKSQELAQEGHLRALEIATTPRAQPNIEEQQVPS